MWKATKEQLNELKFVLNSNKESHLYYWGNFDYEFNAKTNELSDFNDDVETFAIIESFEHFKQVMKILLTERLYNSTWEDEIKELTEQIENL